MRLIQFESPPNAIRRVGVVENDIVFDLTSLNPTWDRVHKVFIESMQTDKSLEDFIQETDYRKYCLTFDKQVCCK